MAHDTQLAQAGSARVETRSFEHVPLDERHGETKSLFFLWFGEQFSSFALVTGALAITLGLNFWWSIVAIIAGNLIGASMMAGHSAQGPALGLPQMIQSRAQFGFYGTLLPLAITWCMYVCFSAVAVVIAGAIQVALGFLRAGIIGYYFPSSVIRGMLAAIGLTLILKQLPYALGAGIAPLESDALAQPHGGNTLTAIVDAARGAHPTAVILTLAALLYWLMSFLFL